MQNVIAIVSFKLNDANLLGEWKIISDNINQSLNGVDGFISRDSAIGEDGKVYCILKWENVEKQNAFKKVLQSDEFKGRFESFGKIVNIETMNSENLKVI